MPPNPISIRLGDAQRAELASRQQTDSLSESLRLIVDRYLALLADGRKRAARILTPEEMGLICDALNGTETADTTWVTNPLLAWEVEESLADGLAKKWSVDGLALVVKLKSLDPAASLAVLDAVERFCAAGGRGETPDPREALR